MGHECCHCFNIRRSNLTAGELGPEYSHLVSASENGLISQSALVVAMRGNDKFRQMVLDLRKARVEGVNDAASEAGSARKRFKSTLGRVTIDNKVIRQQEDFSELYVEDKFLPLKTWWRRNCSRVPQEGFDSDQSKVTFLEKETCRKLCSNAVQLAGSL